MGINGADDTVHGWRFSKLGSSLNTMLNGTVILLAKLIFNKKGTLSMEHCKSG